MFTAGDETSYFISCNIESIFEHKAFEVQNEKVLLLFVNVQNGVVAW
jgi:hypothetical protein